MCSPIVRRCLGLEGEPKSIVVVDGEVVQRLTLDPLSHPKKVPGACIAMTNRISQKAVLQNVGASVTSIGGWEQVASIGHKSSVSHSCVREWKHA